MRKRVAESRITLKLPKEISKRAEKTELNYRTCITTPAQDAATTIRLLSILTLVFVAVGVALRFLTVLPTWGSYVLLGVLVVATLVLAYRNFLRGTPSGLELLLALLGGLVTVLFAFVNFAPTLSSAYVAIFGTALLIATAFSHLATTQACAWMAVNERIKLRTVRRWQRYRWLITRSWAAPWRCPELSHYRQSFALLLLAFAAGYGVVRVIESTDYDRCAAILGVLTFFASLVIIRLVIRGPRRDEPTPILETLRKVWETQAAGERRDILLKALKERFRFPTVVVTWKALTTFLCYNRHQVDAGGLFRFPARPLRSTLARDLFLGVTLAFLTTALVGACMSSPAALIERYAPASKGDQGASPAQVEAGGMIGEPPALLELGRLLPPPPPLPYGLTKDSIEAFGVTYDEGDRLRQSVPSEPAAPEFKLTPLEEQFSRTLPEPTRVEYYVAKKKEHEDALAASKAEAERRARVRLIAGFAFMALLCWLGPSIILFTVMWFIGGCLLHRFHLALEAPKAYELPEEPSKEDVSWGGRGTTPWDNRIERLRWTRDELEKEHFYLGTSLEGDFPVLLHQDLLYRHGHILGDTGSRKTSIGIAPLVTQLIARETNSVVIFDLKGDRTLFNAVREEAEAVGIPFKWFTNITGQSSYAFNPLQQSHLSRLTTDQLTQGLLQALDLEHGEGYGRGHFTALNDAVLGAYLRRYRHEVSSFEELYKYVSDKNAYRSISSDPDDYRHTRQLVNLVNKLAHVRPMNVTPKNSKDKPRVIEEQIDMASVLREPQVVYFYLSSTLDPRTVSPIAKLAMFSLLAASEFRTGIQPRTFVFIDEFQRVISEAITLFFEQARSKGLHFILANQALSQLNSKGVDITGVIESCTGFKQSFRASDEANIKRIIEGSGEAVYHDVSWNRIVSDAYDEKTPHLLSLAHTLRRHSGDVTVNVNRTVGPRIERNSLIEASALPLASFIHFDEGSGYTQYSGYWTTMISEYHISKPLYDFFEEEPIPPVDEETVEVLGDPPGAEQEQSKFKDGPVFQQDVPQSFDEELEKRLNAAGSTGASGATNAPEDDGENPSPPRGT